MYTATYLTVCYGWRVGIVKAIDTVNATAAPTSDFKLIYLVQFCYLLPYSNPSPAANPLQKQRKPQFPSQKRTLPGGHIERPEHYRAQNRLFGHPHCSQ